MDKRLYSPAEAAEYIGICTKSIYTLIKNGELTAYKSARYYVIPVGELEKLREDFFPDGITMHQLAECNNLSFESVRARLSKYRIKPTGTTREGRYIYSRETLEKMEPIIKLRVPLENHPRQSLSRAPVQTRGD